MHLNTPSEITAWLIGFPRSREAQHQDDPVPTLIYGSIRYLCCCSSSRPAARAPEGRWADGLSVPGPRSGSCCLLVPPSTFQRLSCSLWISPDQQLSVDMAVSGSWLFFFTPAAAPRRAQARAHPESYTTIPCCLFGSVAPDQLLSGSGRRSLAFFMAAGCWRFRGCSSTQNLPFVP